MSESTNDTERDDGGLISEDILGLEVFKQKSVGIDIGSSTSHLIFSELTLRREGFSSRFRVTDRQVLFQSPILLTPYVAGTLIDAEALQTFIEEAYKLAGVEPDDIDSGAIVVTGEALKKENAQPIAEMFSKHVGKFICVSAGPNHEALLAAYGSGAAAFSEDNGWRLLNVDVGGGTTKFTLIDKGKVLETAAIEVGARLIAFDEAGAITRIEGPARMILGEGGADLALGAQATPALQETLSERMMDCLFDLILKRPPSALTESLMLTPMLDSHVGLEGIDRVVFSGGVSEYVYGRDQVAYGDLGPLLGQGLRKRFDDQGLSHLIASSPSGIRATVIGAGEYTIQASGNTSFLSNIDHLPAYALKVVKVEPGAGESFQEATRRALRKFDLTAYGNGLALAITLDDVINYPYLRSKAEEIAAVVEGAASDLAALFLVVDKDVAKTLGSLLKEELGMRQDVIAIDSIDLGDLDYVDIGRPMGETEVLPVTVKSLVFPTKLDG